MKIVKYDIANSDNSSTSSGAVIKSSSSLGGSYSKNVDLSNYVTLSQLEAAIHNMKHPIGISAGTKGDLAFVDENEKYLALFYDGGFRVKKMNVDGEGTLTVNSGNFRFDVNADSANIANDVNANNLYANNEVTANTGDIHNIYSKNITTENLEVTKAAHFFSLIIDEIKSVGGRLIITPANAEIYKVDYQDNYFRCYFKSTDGDKQINQEFVENDLVICQTFNGSTGETYNVSNTYYWRKVINVGTSVSDVDGVTCWYIDLSENECDPNSNASPKRGDKIVQLGNTTDVDRQSAIIISAYNDGYLDPTIKAPSIAQYKGIGSNSNNLWNIEPFRLNVLSRELNEFKLSNGTDLNSKIEQTATSLTSTIESVSGTLDSKIEQTATSITASIKNEVEKDFGNYYTKNETDSKIEQTSSSITSTVTSTINTKLDNYYTKEETKSEINQTSNSISLNVTSDLEGKLKNTGIDIESGKITLGGDGALVDIQGDLNIHKSNEGLVVFDGDGDAKVKILNAEVDDTTKAMNLVQSFTVGESPLFTDLKNSTTGTVTNKSDMIYSLGNNANGSTISIQAGEIKLPTMASIPYSEADDGSSVINEVPRFTALTYTIQVVSSNDTVVKQVSNTISPSSFRWKGATAYLTNWTSANSELIKVPYFESSFDIPSLTVNITSSGTYRIKVSFSAKYKYNSIDKWDKTGYLRDEHCFSLANSYDYRYKASYEKKSTNLTVIGTNGICSVVGADKYFYIDSNECTIKWGEEGIKLSDKGIQRYYGSNLGIFNKKKIAVSVGSQDTQKLVTIDSDLTILKTSSGYGRWAIKVPEYDGYTFSLKAACADKCYIIVNSKDFVYLPFNSNTITTKAISSYYELADKYTYTYTYSTDLSCWIEQRN